MLSLVWWLIVGLIAGGLARLLMPGKDPMSLFATILLGIAGSILGGLVSLAVWRVDNRGFRPAGLLLSLAGAILILWIWRAVRSSKTV